MSSIQFDDAERGLSYMRDGPLDMRMDQAVSGGTWAGCVFDVEAIVKNSPWVRNELTGYVGK